MSEQDRFYVRSWYSRDYGWRHQVGDRHNGGASASRIFQRKGAAFNFCAQLNHDHGRYIDAMWARLRENPAGAAMED